MTQKIETTTKKFREGTEIREKAVEIAYESTGHLSVRLLDASGTVPLADRRVRVAIEGEGEVELVTDADGKLFHPDVPFQDYEIHLDEASVWAAAVATRDVIAERVVDEVRFAFVVVDLRDASGFAMAHAQVEVSGPGGTQSLETDARGRLRHREPLLPGRYRLSCEAGRAEVELPSHPHRAALVRVE